VSRLLTVLVLALVLPSFSSLAQTPILPGKTPPLAPAQPIIPAPPEVAARAWVLMDAASGKMIMEHNPDERMAPASLTKMMTGYVLSEAIRTGKVKWEDTQRITPNSWAQNPLFVGSSLMWVDINSDVTLRDLYYGLVISSGNDASVAIAEHLAGSEQAFADLMNQQAARLGLTNTHFVNSHGQPDPNHYTTARDLALLSRAMINDHPQDYAVYAQTHFMYNNIRQMNRNELLGEPGVDGIKTGHTEAAGYCLVSSATQGEMRLIAVVLGTASRAARTEESRKMLGYGFRFFETRQVVAAGTPLTEQPVRVWSGAADGVTVGVANTITVTVPRGRAGELKAMAVDIQRALKAPIEAGQQLGQVSITLGEEEIQRAPLVALEAVERGGFFRRLWDGLVLFFLQLFGKA
jgi:D-alanyl-D-alanine carboxypeptidase (penicillin-binding protein 5/6)